MTMKYEEALSLAQDIKSICQKVKEEQNNFLEKEGYDPAKKHLISQRDQEILQGKWFHRKELLLSNGPCKKNSPNFCEFVAGTWPNV
jgi:hypothetical protein